MINEMEHEDTIKKEEDDDDKVFDEAVDGDDDSIGSDSQTSLHVENEAKDATTKADNNMTEAKDTTEANDSDTSNAMSEIVAVLKSARRALEVWILLLVGIETGDGLLQLKSLSRFWAQNQIWLFEMYGSLHLVLECFQAVPFMPLMLYWR